MKKKIEKNVNQLLQSKIDQIRAAMRFLEIDQFEYDLKRHDVVKWNKEIDEITACYFPIEEWQVETILSALQQEVVRTTLAKIIYIELQNRSYLSLSVDDVFNHLNKILYPKQETFTVTRV